MHSPETWKRVVQKAEQCLSFRCGCGFLWRTVSNHLGPGGLVPLFRGALPFAGGSPLTGMSGQQKQEMIA